MEYVTGKDLKVGDKILVSRFSLDLRPGFYNPPPPPVPRTVKFIRKASDELLLVTLVEGEEIRVNVNQSFQKQ